MDKITFIANLITEISIILGVVIPIIVWILLIVRAIRCILRTEMLRIYYRHSDDGKIRQYEYENFVKLYGAYKALRGNSFIDKIYKEIQTWEVIT